MATESLLECFEIAKLLISDTGCGKDMVAHRIAKKFENLWIDIQPITFGTANGSTEASALLLYKLKTL